MARIYRDLAETINKTTFDVRIPDNYNPTLPGYYKKFPNRRPIYDCSSPDCFSRMTIKHMVEMCNNEIVFTICKKEDLLMVVNLLDAYIKDLRIELDEDTPDHHPAKVYMLNAEYALGIIGKHTGRSQRMIDDESLVEKQNSAADLIRGLSALRI